MRGRLWRPDPHGKLPPSSRVHNPELGSTLGPGRRRQPRIIRWHLDRRRRAHCLRLMGRYAGSPYHQYLGSPATTVGGMHWVVPEDDQILGTASLNKQHVPGNGPLDDNTLQREQTSYW